MSQKNLIILLGSIVLLAGICIFVWLSFFNTANNQTSSPYTQLIQNNPDFIKAQDSFKNGQYTEAVDVYKQILTNIADTDQKLVIYYYLGTAKNITGEHTEAVELLKQVVAAESLPKETRAYAAQYLGIMATNLSSSTAHNLIMAEIFKDSPYKEMYVQNNEGLSIRHIFDYAASLYPLAISEANIANWYMGNILTNNLSTTTNPGLYQFQLIQEGLIKVDQDIERTRGQLSSSLIPQALGRKAEITEGLLRLGVVSKDAVIQAYTETLEAYSVYTPLPGEDWFTRFRYAAFLASYTPDAEQAIEDAIRPLYANPEYAPVVNPFLKTLNTKILTKSPSSALERNKLKAWEIGRVNSGFRNLLISLGWQNNF